MKNFSLHAILPCFLLLAFSILQASAQQAVLNRPVTVAVQDGTFSEAAGQIERQTGLMFLYKSDDIDRNRKISLNVRNRPLSEALDLLLRGTRSGIPNLRPAHHDRPCPRAVVQTGHRNRKDHRRVGQPDYRRQRIRAGTPTAPPRERAAVSVSRHRRATRGVTYLATTGKSSGPGSTSRWKRNPPNCKKCHCTARPSGKA